MNGAIAVFVKTPELSPVKTRLANSIGREKAEEFFTLAAKAVEEVLLVARARLDNQIDTYWAVGEKEGCDHPRWQEMPCIYTGDGGLGERLHHVYSSLLENHDYVILLGADSPQISSEHIIKVHYLMQEKKRFLIGPATDGGFYLFAGNQEIAKEVWTEVPYSVDTTMEMLKLKLQAEELDSFETILDVDTVEDLQRLHLQMTGNRLPMQDKLFFWLKENGMG